MNNKIQGKQDRKLTLSLSLIEGIETQGAAVGNGFVVVVCLFVFFFFPVSFLFTILENPIFFPHLQPGVPNKARDQR